MIALMKRAMGGNSENQKFPAVTRQEGESKPKLDLTQIPSRFAPALFWTFPEVQELRLSDKMLPALTFYPSVETLRVEWVGDPMPQLRQAQEHGVTPRHLYLSTCPQLKDEDVAWIINTWGKGLRGLGLNSCGNMTNTVLTHIQDGCPSLEILSLISCTQLSGLRIAALCAGLSLTSLNLSHCAIEDEHLAVLPSSLHKLSLYGCRELSNAGLAYIENNCPDLVELDLSYCTIISNETIADYRRKHPTIKLQTNGR